MPCAMAPACPLVPPPATLTLTSNLRWVLVIRSGASAASSSTRRPRNARGSFSLTVIRPSPGCIRTRATAFLRRPVPRLNVSANVDIPLRVERDGPGLLRLMAVVGSGVDAEAGQHVRPQRVALEHSAHGVRHREGGVELLRPPKRPLAQTTGIAGVPRVFLGFRLGPRDLDLGGVDHYHVVACVQVRREGGLVLATQDLGHTARKAAEDLVSGIDHEPIALQIRRFRRPRLLLCQLRSFSKSLPSGSSPPLAQFSAPSAGRAP